MAYRSFRQFLDNLEQAGELKRIAIPVDTDLLIAEWADREMKSPGGGKRCYSSNRLSTEKNQNSQSQSTRWARAAVWRSRCRCPTWQTSHRKFNLFLKPNRQPTCAKVGPCLNKEFICCMRVQNQCAKRRVRKSCTKSAMATRFRRRIFPSSSAGRKTVGVSSPWQMCTRATQKQARAM